MKVTIYDDYDNEVMEFFVDTIEEAELEACNEIEKGQEAFGETNWHWSVENDY